MKHDDEKKTQAEKKEYIEKVEEKLQDMDRQIDEKQMETESAKEEQKHKLHRELEEMKTRSEQAKKKLQELKTAGGDTWKNVKKHMDASLEDLKKFRQRVFHR